MTALHRTLAGGRWQELPLAEQMANIGSEVGRAAVWLRRNERADVEASLRRALELLDLTIADARWRGRTAELLRLREVLIDTFGRGAVYGVRPEELERYFLPFALAARNRVQV